MSERSPPRDKVVRWLLALALLALGVRLALFFLSEPASYGDTPTYWRLADVLVERGFSGYDATRVPGYPLLIGLLGGRQRTVWMAQLLMGGLTTLSLFFLGVRLTADPRLAFSVGAIHTLAPGQVLFESNLLSETLTTFLVTLSLVLCLAMAGAARGWRRLALALACGVVASLAGLVRTLFFLLPVLILLYLLTLSNRWQRRLAMGGAFSLAPLLMLGGWIGFVYGHYGMLSPTTMGGYHLVQHTGAFFEHLPEQEAVIRDTYLEFRRAQVEERGVQTNAIWDAIPILSERTGLSFFALSGKLQELSLRLIREHPLLYMRSVFEGWVSFWKAPVYWQPDLYRPPLARLLSVGLLAGRGVFILANGLFLLLTAGAVISPRLRTKLDPPPFIHLCAGLVLTSSVVQTLVDHGDNPRFLVPLQMVVVLVVVWAGWRFWAGRGQEATVNGS